MRNDKINFLTTKFFPLLLSISYRREALRKKFLYNNNIKGIKEEKKDFSLMRLFE